MASVEMFQAKAPVSKKGLHRTVSILGGLYRAFGMPGCGEPGLHSRSVMR